jgi:outer membrane protein W
MKKLMFLSLLAAACPLFAQRRVDFIFDVEGVRRTGNNTSYSPGTVRFEPSFGTGGGIGAGLNFFLSDRVSLEAKAAGIEANMNVRIVGSDSVQIISLGRAQIYPISAILQWHLAEHGTLRPYIGAGVVHTILRNINRKIPSTTATGVRFRDPTGLVVDGGLELSLGKRWSIYGDARYVPLETTSRASFIGTTSVTNISVRPLIVSTGIAYHF